MTFASARRTEPEQPAQPEHPTQPTAPAGPELPARPTHRIPRPPVPPALHAWPVAVRSAALLRGVAVRCGPGIRLVSWPDTPIVRAAAIGDSLFGYRVAAHLTAAWIWGAAEEPGSPLEFALLRGRIHQTEPFAGVALHQYRFDDGEILRLGPFAVTSPERTLYDLLRADEFTAPHRIACRMLLAHSALSRAHLRSLLQAQPRPYEQRLLRRLERL